MAPFLYRFLLQSNNTISIFLHLHKCDLKVMSPFSRGKSHQQNWGVKRSVWEQCHNVDDDSNIPPCNYYPENEYKNCEKNITEQT